MWTLLVFVLGGDINHVQKVENIKSKAECLAIKREVEKDLSLYKTKFVFSCIPSSEIVKS